MLSKDGFVSFDDCLLMLRAFGINKTLKEFTLIVKDQKVNFTQFSQLINENWSAKKGIDDLRVALTLLGGGESSSIKKPYLSKLMTCTSERLNEVENREFQQILSNLNSDMFSIDNLL